MSIRFCVLLLLLPVLFGGCASFRAKNRQDACEKMIKDYNRMIRWQEAEKAGIAFVDAKQRPSFDKGAEALRRRGVTVADYRILAKECLVEKKKAESTVEFDYFVMPNNRLKTVTDHQSWIFIEENPAEPELKEGWRLVSPLPEFK
ncbi:hypothetical protein [Trichlorobacter lovleyi]|jgi:hypothetical protein|uniref:Lipoprotein, putative n=1 Tax=Trichlorobacter lovleyi (strain ATCC BAA-1151 / DSM 17278 / SZ) TaxID=398767 RepID=B3E1H6_TRIL1|nr:hypothetical protein [Trichlorobacter lovleyi]ACD94068.1 lipoprotein, putative [Trichlorobacter lovleyi SZ]